MRVPLQAAWQQTQDGEKAALCTPIFVDPGAGRCGDGGWLQRKPGRKPWKRFLVL